MRWTRLVDAQALQEPLLDNISENDIEEEPYIVIEMQNGYQAGRGLGQDHIHDRWCGVRDLDDFFQKIYLYYNEKGLWPSAMRSFYTLIQLLVVAALTLFVVTCIDYKELYDSDDFSRVVHFENLARPHPLLRIALAGFAIYWICKLVRFALNFRKLMEIREFYREALHIPDADMETILWSDIVQKLIEAQKHYGFCRIKSELTEHDIASRLMRRENFLIAMYNKGVLPQELTLPVLHLKMHFIPTSLEWLIETVVLDFFFDKAHCVHDEFLKEDRGGRLAAQLSQRFKFYGVLALIKAPLTAAFLMLYFFFRYAVEFKRNPRSLGTRRWASWVKWKAREFNELSHIFRKRLSLAYEPAEAYIDSFTSELTVATARFVAFISGALVGILMFLAVYSENILTMHLLHDRSGLWCLGVLTVVLAAARGMVPDENQVFQPEKHMTEVLCHLHDVPARWKGHYHTLRVKNEFSQYFEYKIVSLLQELMGAFITPFVLYFVLPSYSRDLVEFFRNFTVYRDGVGHVCSFANFDFKRHGNAKYGVTLSDQPAPSAYEQTCEGKMEKSFVSFQAHNPRWAPPPEGVALLRALDEHNSSLNLGDGTASLLVDTVKTTAAPRGGKTQAVLRGGAGAATRPRLDGEEAPFEGQASMSSSLLVGESEAMDNLCQSMLVMESLHEQRCLERQ